MSTLRIDHATVIAHRGSQPVVLPDQSIVIDGSKIRAVMPTHVAQDPRLGYATAEEVRHLGGVTHPTGPATRIDEIIDGSKHLVIPGLVNTHHHLYQSLTRGLKPVQSAPLFDWLRALYQRWQNLTFDAVKLASQISIAELLLSGCTTTSDHYYLFPRGSDVGLHAVLEAAESLGIRIHACRGSMSVGQSKGGLPPDACVEDEAEILRNCR